MAINGLAMRTAARELLVISGEGELTPEDKTTIDGLSKSLDTDKDGVIDEFEKEKYNFDLWFKTQKTEGFI